jgi:hypothetical protein
MNLQNNRHGKFFGPVQVYMGLVFIACGLFCSTYSLTTLLFIVPGAFMAFTSTGTIIDLVNKRVKPYTSLFGFIRTGEWIEVSVFSQFKIMKSDRRYSSYSRGSVRFNMNISDISLLLTNNSGTKKVILSRFNKFEDAHMEMNKLNGILLPVTKFQNPE